MQKIWYRGGGIAAGLAAGGSGGMVTAAGGVGLPGAVGGAATPARTRSGVAEAGKEPFHGVVAAAAAADERPLLGGRSGDDSDEEGPAASPAAASGPEEDGEAAAARRDGLTRELDARGIRPEYDPKGELDSAGAVGGGAQALVCESLRGAALPALRAFIHDPVPRSDGMLRCHITRNRTGINNKLYPKYTLELDGGVFLMSAQKQKNNMTANYAITMSKAQIEKDADTYVGKMRSDMMGLEWVAYSPGLNPAKADPQQMTQQTLERCARQELLAVQYGSTGWVAKSKGPRKMNMVIPRVRAGGERLVCRTLRPQAEGLLALQRNDATTQIDSYQNKAPKWDDRVNAYVLNFKGRVTEASVKNFQLVNGEDPDTIYLQFGRTGKEVFNIDFRYPFSPFQAFALCLSSLDHKLGCD